MVDPKSYELAEEFLDDFEPVKKDLIMELAQCIQDAIEDWLNAAVRDSRIKEAK